MQKPNVLFISSWYPSKEHPTLGNFVQRHAEAINPFVNLFVVYVTSSSTIDKEFEITGPGIVSIYWMSKYLYKFGLFRGI